MNRRLMSASVFILMVSFALPHAASAHPFDLTVDVGPTLAGTLTARVDTGATYKGFRLGVNASSDTLYQPEEIVSQGASEFAVEWLDNIIGIKPEVSWTLELGSFSLSPWAGFSWESRERSVNGTSLWPGMPELLDDTWNHYRSLSNDGESGPAGGLRLGIKTGILRLGLDLDAAPLLTSTGTGQRIQGYPSLPAITGLASFVYARDDWESINSGFRYGGKVSGDIALFNKGLELGGFGGFWMSQWQGQEESATRYWTVSGSTGTGATITPEPTLMDENTFTTSTQHWQWEAGVRVRLSFIKEKFPSLGTIPTISFSAKGWTQDYRADNVDTDDIISSRTSFVYYTLGLSFGL